MVKTYPETKPPGIYPEDMNRHLHPVWCNIRNDIVRDQEAVKANIERIRDNKKSIRFFQARILANHTALAQIAAIKEK